MSPSVDGSGLEELVTGQLDSDALDSLFAALADQHRRAALDYLSDCGGTVRFDDLVEVVASRTTDDDATYTDRTEIATALHHVHLPKLEAAGLVAECDPNGVVSACDRVADLPSSLVDPR